jgi:hypothetical protein
MGTRTDGGGAPQGRPRTYVLASAMLVLLAIALAACSGQASSGSGTKAMAATAAGMRKASTASEEATQKCASCMNKELPPVVIGAVKVSSAVQILSVGVEGGFYSPNKFTVSAGKPVRVVFAGKAMGCLAKPMFKSLGKKADFTSGAATLDLGTLAPGTYTWTCGMGKNPGTITVE